MNENSKVHHHFCVSSISSSFIAHLLCVPWSSCPVQREADSWTLRPGSASALKEACPPLCSDPCPASAAIPAFPAGGTWWLLRLCRVGGSRCQSVPLPPRVSVPSSHRCPLKSLLRVDFRYRQAALFPYPESVFPDRHRQVRQPLLPGRAPGPPLSRIGIIGLANKSCEAWLL